MNAPKGNRNGAVLSKTSSSSSRTSQVYGDQIFEAGGEFDVVSLVHSQLPETKLNAFAAIRDRSVCVKGTKEFRLAKSVCYDFGKILAELCPPHLTDKESKFFIKTNFDRWISQYDNLGPFFDVLIPRTRKETGPKRTLVGLLRMSAQLGRKIINKNGSSLLVILRLPPGLFAR